MIYFHIITILKLLFTYINYNINISLVLFKKFTWLFVNLDKTKLEKIAKKILLDIIIFKKLNKKRTALLGRSAALRKKL